jgi:hypothetical protein
MLGHMVALVIEGFVMYYCPRVGGYESFCQIGAQVAHEVTEASVEITLAGVVSTLSQKIDFKPASSFPSPLQVNAPLFQNPEPTSFNLEPSRLLTSALGALSASTLVKGSASYFLPTSLPLDVETYSEVTRTLTGLVSSVSHGFLYDQLNNSKDKTNPALFLLWAVETGIIIIPFFYEYYEGYLQIKETEI